MIGSWSEWIYLQLWEYSGTFKKMKKCQRDRISVDDGWYWRCDGFHDQFYKFGTDTFFRPHYIFIVVLSPH